MYISLYRRYRPQTFSDMVGQSAAVGVLMESLREGSLGHAYLFSGPRGCGKTSAARLVAKSLDCQSRGKDCEPCGVCENCRAIAAGEHLDVIEIDGASNRGIGEIRDLKSHVSLKPLSAAYKVYIIDEVHMLTDAAFNALLKTLEEPPANVVFLLATTEPHKVPVTIRSRCQHIPFHRITIADTVARLKYVCEQEKIPCEEEAAWEVARQADGALRDALSITEQAVALGRGSLSLESVRELTGGSSRTELERWVTLLRTEPRQAAAEISSIMARGISPERLCESLFVLFRDLWYYSLWSERALDALESSAGEKKYLETESPNWSPDKLEAACLLCNRLLPRTHFGMKGDVFSGLVFMELRNIIDGRTAVTAAEPSQQPQQPASQRIPTQAAAPASQPAPQRSQPQYAEEPSPFFDDEPYDMPQSQQAPPAPQRAQKRTAPAADAPSFSAAPLSGETLTLPKPDVEELCARLGAGDFSKLIAGLEADWIPVASALLRAELSLRGGRLEISFERPMPAKNYLSAQNNRSLLERAAAKLWELPEAKTEGGAAEAAKAPEPAPEEQKRPERQPAARDEKEEAKPAEAAMSRILRLAGAELLYVHSADSEEEESEGNE